MKRYVKVIYEDIVKSEQGQFEVALKETLAPFGPEYTEYDGNANYADNFEKFVVDAFECGFIRISEFVAIPVFQIKKFLEHAPKEAPKKKAVGKKPRYGKRPDSKKVSGSYTPEKTKIPPPPPRPSNRKIKESKDTPEKEEVK